MTDEHRAALVEAASRALVAGLLEGGATPLFAYTFAGTHTDTFARALAQSPAPEPELALPLPPVRPAVPAVVDPRHAVAVYGAF